MLQKRRSRYMNNNKSLQGGCLCGKIRYRIESKPLFVNHCHCQQCRRHSGAVFMTHMGIPVEDFSWLKGEPTYWHSKVMDRGFCANCGSTISALYHDEPSIIVMPLGTLDDADKIKPAYHIMTEYQISWLNIVDELPRHARLSPGYEHLDEGL